jgi:hypothetical protein
VTGRAGNEVGEAFDRHDVAVADAFFHGVGKGEKTRH